jgi:hypothetical protein
MNPILVHASHRLILGESEEKSWDKEKIRSGALGAVTLLWQVSCYRDIPDTRLSADTPNAS